MIFDTYEECLALVKGDRAAADFIHCAVDVLHFWDDLVDRDKVLSDDAVNQAMHKALIVLPRNPFYAQNFSVLNTVLMNSITNWMVANKFERDGGEYERRIAYILRSSYVDLITSAALIVGGPVWAVEVGGKIRHYAHKETYEGYLSNLQKEQKTRTELEINHVL